MEGVKDGRRFFEIAREVAKEKPIILWKGGRSEQGAKAAASHTGALAGSASVWNAMFRQTGIVNVRSMEEVVDCVLAFHYLPLPKGHRTAVIVSMGGTGVATADNCLDLGLELPSLSDETVSRLKAVIPALGASVGNPADLGVASLMDPSVYGKAIEIVAEDEGIDMLLVVTLPPRACVESVAAARTFGKPMAVSVSALPEYAADEYRLLTDNGIPPYSDPRRAAYALSRLAEYAGSLAVRQTCE
jgi:acetyltransferase